MLNVASVDWREVLLDLQHFYPKPKDVARELHGVVSETAVRKYIEDTTEPSHVRGELILNLWCRTTGKRREDAPRRPHERI
ncbi:hypothetical protein LGN21_04535 [Burkholderia cepacia]|uniref:hypothetical protein n=1 Tax=Burkholderia cepacia TaxID=292 RepID=UPI001CF2BDFA|nr:hypothetical protein [Burkholderia cepacia]MCA8278848.1 hypothetical protein [Burkholderia cepacia]